MKNLFRRIGWTITVFVGLLIAICVLIFWSNPLDKYNDYTIVNDGWEVQCNNYTITTSFPYALSNKDNLDFTVSRKLSDKDFGIERNDTRFIYLISYYCDVYAYIDDQLITVYECNKTRTFMTEGMTYHFIRLPDHSEGRILTVKYVPQMHINKYRIAPIIIGGKGDIIRHLYNNGLVDFALISVIFTLGVCLILTNFAMLRNNKNNSSNLIFLGMFAIMCGIYLGARIEWVRVSLSRPMLIYVTEFLSQLCMLTPLIIFFANVVNEKSCKMLMGCMCLNVFMTFLQLILYFGTRNELREMLVFSHIVLFVTVAVFIVIIFVLRDLQDKYRKEITFSVIPLVIFGIMDVLVYYLSPTLQSGFMLKLGLILFMISELVYNVHHFTRAIKRDRENEIFRELAYKDLATNLKNRNAFTDDCNYIERNKSTYDCIKVLFFDLNYLKYTNDNFGHEAGDKLIGTMAHLLNETFEGQSVYRIGGDEFVVIITDKAIDVQEKLEIMENFKRNYSDVYGNKFDYAYGTADYSEGTYENISALVRSADEMMYNNKKLAHMKREQ